MEVQVLSPAPVVTCSELRIWSDFAEARRILNAGGETRIALYIPEEKGEKQVLSDEELLELSTLISHIENHYSFPCDIEWVFENGKFYIVQNRPSTTIKERSETEIIIELLKKHTDWVKMWSGKCSINSDTKMGEMWTSNKMLVSEMPMY